jgi:hypothetical protein
MSEPVAPSGWDIAAIIAGTLAVLGALGKAGAWLLAWGDRRHQARMDRLAREEDELAESWSAFRKRVSAELVDAKATIVELGRRDIARAKENAALRVAFELVAGALRPRIRATSRCAMPRPCSRRCFRSTRNCRSK